MGISQTLPAFDRTQPQAKNSQDYKILSGDLSQVTEKSVLASLMESLHDVIAPPKAPPLHTTSRPIVLPDRMAVKRDPRATGLAIVINCFALVALIWFGSRKIVAVVTPRPVTTHVTLVDPLPPPPVLPVAPPKAVAMSGGGGQHTPIPVSHGNPPKFEPKPTIMPAVQPTAAPKITMAVQPTINVQADLKMAKADVPSLGISSAPSVVVSAGNGAGAGLGAGFGNGLGSGSGGNFGGGVFKVGGGVSEPQVISAPAPGFTEEARQAKVSGKVIVYLQVSPDGRPMHVRLVRGLGMGLDEKALEAVRQYRFKPAMKDGHPVTVEMNVEVNFQILS